MSQSHPVNAGAAGPASRYLLLTLFMISALAPGYLMVSGSLKTQAQFLDSPWGLPSPLSFAAYARAADAGLPLWFVNTIIVTGASVVGVIVIAALAAWGFAHWAFRGRETLLGIVVSLMVVPPVVLLIPLFQLGAQLDLISTFRLVVVTYIGLMLPFSIYLLASFFSSIPPAILEAAEIDGASPWKAFRHIVIPLSGAPLATLAVVNIMWAWNELLLALVFLQTDDKKTLMVGLAGFKGRFSLDVPTVMAGLTLVTLPLVLAYMFGQRYFIQGLTAGGSKGD
jgi:ABC-type glycerol-3-phosphate transport system permease component